MLSPGTTRRDWSLSKLLAVSHPAFQSRVLAVDESIAVAEGIEGGQEEAVGAVNLAVRGVAVPVEKQHFVSLVIVLVIIHETGPVEGIGDRGPVASLVIRTGCPVGHAVSD